MRTKLPAWLPASVLFTLVLACASAAQAQPVRVSMQANRTELNVGDNLVVQISIQVQGGDQPSIQLPDFEHFEVVQRSVQRPMSFSMGFGQGAPTVTSATNYTFVLQPTAAGHFRIPQVRAAIGGRTYTSQPLDVVVHGGNGAQAPPPQNTPNTSDPNAQPSAAQDPQAGTPAPQDKNDVAAFDGEAFLRTVVDKVEPYQGDQVTVTIYLYARRGLDEGPAIRTEPSTDGFWTRSLYTMQDLRPVRRESARGGVFYVYVLRRFAAFPLRSGDLTLGSMRLTISHNDIFDLMDPSRAQAPLTRASVPVLLHVKPLPEAGKPAGDVAVGKIDVTAKLDRAQVMTGDAVQLTATVHGTGNLEAVKLADPSVPGLDVLQPETHVVMESPGDLVQGTRTFQWLMVPRAPGTYAIPAIALDTFDPATGKYQHIASQPMTITAVGNATPAAAAAPSAPSAPDSAQQPAPDSDDKPESWPPLRTRSAFARATHPIADNPLFAWGLLLPPLAWLATLIVPAVRRRLRNREGSKERERLRTARERLDEAQSALQKSDGPRFHAQLASALAQLVAAKLDANIAGLTRSETRGVLAERGVPESEAKELLALLESCDTARFSPAGSDPNEMQRLYARAQALFGTISTLRVGAAALACVLGALLLAGVAHAEGFGDIFRAGNDAFFQGNHAKAEAQYERLVSAGVQDADVYFNLGLAHARQGELGSAIWCFEKSARLAPGDADPVNAIATARAALGKRRAERQGEATVEARPPLAEALVQAYREDTLALWLALLDVLCFGLLIAWRFAGTDTLRTGLAIGAAIGLLGACVAGAALLVKRGGFSEGQAAIILHEAAELREGPDPRARTRATAHEGARARVLRRDGAFLRVQLDSTGSAAERSDGWMLAKDVGTLD